MYVHCLTHLWYRFKTVWRWNDMIVWVVRLYNGPIRDCIYCARQTASKFQAKLCVLIVIHWNNIFFSCLNCDGWIKSMLWMAQAKSDRQTKRLKHLVMDRPLAPCFWYDFICIKSLFCFMRSSHFYFSQTFFGGCCYCWCFGRLYIQRTKLHHQLPFEACL